MSRRKAKPMFKARKPVKAPASTLPDNAVFLIPHIRATTFLETCQRCNVAKILTRVASGAREGQWLCQACLGDADTKHWGSPW